MDEILMNQTHAVNASENNPEQDKDDCAIVVPAKVSFGNVAMHLDLKIDQKTFAAASGISKAFEEAVCSRISAGTTTGSDNAAGSCRLQIPPAQSHDFLISHNHRNGYSCSNCTCPHDENKAYEGKEQVNEVCSSTVDTSPLCDTASSPIAIDSQGCTDLKRDSCGETYSLDPRPSSSALTSNSSGSYNQIDTSFDPSPSPVGESPFNSRRKRDKISNLSRLCEYTDPKKGPCRQRAIVQYRFCIRHILNDPNAPYHRCEHKRKPKNKSDVVAYCTNAVRKDKGSVFCTTHMIMTGQREPKRKKLVQKVTIDKVKMEDDPDIWVDNSGDNSTWLNNVKTELIEQPVVCLENVNYEQNRINSVSVVHGYESPEVQKSGINERWIVDSESVNSAAAPKVIVKQMSVIDNSHCSTAHLLNNHISNHTNQNVAVIPVSVNASNVAGQNFPVMHPVRNVQIVENGPCCSKIATCPLRVEQVVVQRIAMQQPLSPQLLYRDTSSTLTKQHPQLAAKLLENSIIYPQQVHSSLNFIQHQNFRSGVMGHTILKPLPHIPQQLLSDDSQLLKPNYYALTDDENDVDSSDSAKRLIKLCQKKRKPKIKGWYRKVPVVNEMCKAFELLDSDEADLFPLGLEPSDDEDNNSESEQMLEMYEHEQTTDEMSSNSNCFIGALRVYLLKKQLRLDKTRLWHIANRHAAVSIASKLCASGASHAFYDRSKRRSTTKIRQRCAFIIKNSGECDVRCMKTCLPFSNYCQRHIANSISQQLYSYCTERGCSQTFLRTSNYSVSDVCQHHAELMRSQASTNFIETNLSHKSDIPVPMMNSFAERDPFIDDQPIHPSHPLHQNDNAMPFGDPEIFGPSYGIGSEEDLDITFGSGRDLEGQLEQMLDRLPPDAEIGDLESENTKDIDNFSSVNLGHTWDDIEQFLISEGYNNFSSDSLTVNEAGSTTPLYSPNGSNVVSQNFGQHR